MRRDTSIVALAGLLFFLSGVAALVYQVAWQRLLALHSGVGLYSVAMIVAAFMAGLGIGSLQGGRLSTAVSSRRALFTFAALELGIACFGAASPWLYYDWLYPRAVHLASPSWQAGLLHLVALLPPTLLMGMSLPFLVRAVVNDVESASRRIGWLYGVNVLGAATGALATPWLLFPSFGVRGAILAAAGTNLAVGAGSLVLAVLRSNEPGLASAPRVSAEAAALEPPGSRPFRLWLLLYALSGFVALSLEIVWFRVLDVAVKSTAYTFGTVLAVYLLGSGLGALAGAPLASRARRPLRAFLLVQCTLVALAALPLVVVVALPSDTWFFNYWGSYEFFQLGHDADRTSIFRLYVLLPFGLFFGPTLLMGLSFPILQRAVHDDPATSGRKVGLLQAANIAGCVAGSLLVGLVALQRLGTPGTLRVILGTGVVFALVGWRRYGRGFALLALVLCGLAWAVPGPERLWRRLHGIRPEVKLAFFEEDATGVVALTPDAGVGPGGWRLSVNGKGNSVLPYGSGHTLLGAMPATVHPAPRDVAVVGLGSGDTAWASAWRRETRSLTVFEISSPQPRVLWRLLGFVSVLDTRHLLEDPRLRIRIEDGRKALEAEATLYDLIEADATWPETAGSGNLYSVEFFEAAKRRLKPGGVMCSWSPTARVRATFLSVFEHVIETSGGDILIGSADPIAFTPGGWTARIALATEYLGARRVGEVKEAIATLRSAGPPLAIAPNRDLWPRDEYGVK